MIAKDPYRPDDSDSKDCDRPDHRKDSDRPDVETVTLSQRTCTASESLFAQQSVMQWHNNPTEVAVGETTNPSSNH